VDLLNSVASVGPIRPSTVFPLPTDKVEQGAPSFGDMLKGAINAVDSQLNAADQKLVQLSTGDVKDVNEVMLAMQKAQLSLDLTVEIRDRALEAYQTIMRMGM
jgi:flagellar hook-basal body complex protein FliE